MTQLIEETSPVAPTVEDGKLHIEFQYKVGFLNVLAMTLIVLLSAVLVIMLIPPVSPRYDFIIIGISLGLNSVVIYLNRRGQTQIASYVFCATFYTLVAAYISINLFIDVDIDSAITSGYVLSLGIILAGMLIHPRAVFAFALLNTVLLSVSFGMSFDTFDEVSRTVFPILFFSYLLAVVSWRYQSSLQTALRQLENAHEITKQSEARYRNFIEVAQEGIWVIDADSKTTLVNLSMAQMLDYTPDEMLGKQLFDFMDEKGVKLATYNIERRQQGIIEQHDFEFIRKDGKRIYTTIETSPLNDAAGNYIGAIAGIIDITKRKQIEQTMRESEEKYRALIENLTDLILILDKDGINIWNSPAVRRFDMEPEDAIGTSAFEFVHPDDKARLQETLDYVVNNPGETVQLEALKVLLSSGDIVYFDDTFTYLPDTPGINGMVVVVHDITERKRAEESLKIKEAAIDSSINAVVMGDMKGLVTYVNQAFLDLWGYESATDVIGLSATDFWQMPDDGDDASEAMNSLLHQGNWVGEVAGKKPDGTLFDTQSTQHLVRDASNQPVQLFASFINITERKQAEDALKEREAQLRQIVEHLPLSIAMFDKGMRYLQANKLWLDSYNLDIQNIIGKSHYEIFPEIGDDWRAIHQRCLKGDIDRNERAPFPRNDGSLDYIRWEVRPWYYDNEEIGGLLMYTEVITARVQVEEALRENQARLNTLFEYSPISVWEEDFSELKNHIDSLRAAGVQDFRVYLDEHPEEVGYCASLVKILDINQTSVEFFEASNKEEISHNLLSYFEAEALSVFKEEIIALTEGQTRFQSEIPIRVPRSGIKQILLNLIVVPGYEKTLERVLISFIDVTESKQAEAALRESEARLKQAQKIGHLGNWDWNILTNDLYWSDEIYRIFGLKPQQFGATYDAFMERIHPDDRGLVQASVEAALAGKPYKIDHRIVLPNGTERYVQEEGQVTFDVQGQPIHMIGIVSDITERYQAEQYIREQSRLLDVIFQHTLESIVILDKDFNFIRVSEAYAKTGQRDVSEFPGDNHFDLYPSDFEEEAKDVKEKKYIYTKSARPFVFADHPEWGTSYWNLGLVPILDKDDEVEMFLFTLKDVTEGVQAEESIKAALVEKETLLKEIHHRVKNNLQVISSLLHMQSMQIEDSDMIHLFRDSEARVQSMALIHEQLYQTDDLSQIDFKEYVERLVRHVARLQAVNKNIVLDVAQIDPISFTIETAVPCGLIINELVSNAYKHAFPNDVGKIQIKLQAEDSDYVLIIQDDGVGLPADFDMETTKTLGIRLLTMLVMQIDSTLDITSSDGTKVVIRFAKTR